MWDVGGYNKDKVEKIATTINDAFKAVADAIETKLDERLVIPMSTAWYAPEAQDEFKEIDKAVSQMATSMKEAYEGYRSWVQQMGETWAENTGGKKPSLAAVKNRDINLSDGKIKKDNGGNVTLDEQKAITVAADMPVVRQELFNMIKTEHGKLNAASAFIGHGQADAANTCFVKVADALNKLFALLNTLGERLKKYAKKYKEVGESIAEGFNSATIDVSGN